MVIKIYSADTVFISLKSNNRKSKKNKNISENKEEDQDPRIRHLLSIIDRPNDGPETFLSTSQESEQLVKKLTNSLFRSVGEGQQVALPSEDEVYVSNWIANSKQKLLSFNKHVREGRREWEKRYGDWRPEDHPEDTSFLPWERHGEFQVSLLFFDS